MSDGNQLVDPSSQFNWDDYSVNWNKVGQGDYSTLNPITSGPGGDWLSGTGMLDDVYNMGRDVAQNKAGVGDYLTVGLDVLGAAIDPVGTAAGILAGWMMDHIKPLKLILDELGGNPDTIEGVAKTWEDISKALTEGAQTYTNAVGAQTSAWQGDAADAYRTQAAKLVQGMAGAGALADMMGQISTVGGEVAATVRGTVRDIISFLVGYLADLAVEEACTVGAATPAVVAQGVEDIAKATKEVFETVAKVVTIIEIVIAVLNKIKATLEELAKLLPNIKQGMGAAATGAMDLAGSR